MLSKKSSKGDLEGKRTTFTLIAIVIVLGFVYVGFELFATQNASSVKAPFIDDFVTVEDAVPITDQTPPPPPPEPEMRKEYVLNIVEKAISASEIPDFKFEIDPDESIPEVVYIPFVPEVEIEDPPVKIPEVLPEFKGGMDALYKFLSENLIYPERARNNGIQGIVLLEFIVERNGKVTNVKPLVSLFPECDAEAIRVVSMLPDFIPGKVMGKPVRTFYQIPIKFSLVR